MEHLVIKDFLIKPSFLLLWKSHEKQVFFYIHTALTASKASGNSVYLFYQWQTRHLQSDSIKCLPQKYPCCKWHNTRWRMTALNSLPGFKRWVVFLFGWMGQTFLIFRAEQKPTVINGKEKYFLQIHHDLYLHTGRQSKCKHNDRM